MPRVSAMLDIKDKILFRLILGLRMLFNTLCIVIDMYIKCISFVILIIVALPYILHYRYEHSLLQCYTVLV